MGGGGVRRLLPSLSPLVLRFVSASFPRIPSRGAAAYGERRIVPLVPEPSCNHHDRSQTRSRAKLLDISAPRFHKVNE